MAKLLGNNYMWWVESATPGTYNLLKGQKNLSDNRSRPNIDTSDKTTAGYSTGAFGNQSIAMSLDFNVDLPDATGYTRIETAANANATLKYQIRKGGASGVTADAVFECLMYANISGKTYPQDGVVAGKMDFALAAAPTIDTLA